MPNYNRETGVAYGVIAVASLGDWIWDEIDQMDCPGEQEAYAEFMRDRAMELIDKNEIDYEDLDCEEGEEFNGLAEMTDMQVTDLVDSIDPNAGQSFWDGIELGVHRRFGTIDGVRVSVAELGGALNLWVEEGPHMGWYRPCSLCIPGAGDLDSPVHLDDEGECDGPAVLCYDVPLEWRKKGG
jgi:hypothetical protein